MGKTPDHVGRFRQLADIVLGGVATVNQAPDGTTGHLLGQAIEDIGLTDYEIDTAW